LPGRRRKSVLQPSMIFTNAIGKGEQDPYEDKCTG
jgi:hypothetical protein